MEPNLLVSSVSIESLSLVVDWDDLCAGVVKLAKPVWYGPTTAGEISPTQQGVAQFSNISKGNYTVVGQGLTPQDKVDTYKIAHAMKVIL